MFFLGGGGALCCPILIGMIIIIHEMGVRVYLTLPSSAWHHPFWLLDLIRAHLLYSANLACYCDLLIIYPLVPWMVSSNLAMEYPQQSWLIFLWQKPPLFWGDFPLPGVFLPHGKVRGLETESIAGHVCCDYWVQLLANRTLVTRGDIHMGVPYTWARHGYTVYPNKNDRLWSRWWCTMGRNGCFTRQVAEKPKYVLLANLAWQSHFGTSRAPSEKWCGVCCFTSWFNHHKPAGLFFYVFLLKSNVRLGFSCDFSFWPDNTSSDASPAISDGNPM